MITTNRDKYTMHKTFIIGTCMALLIAACGKNMVPDTGSIQGEWKIVQINPPFPHFQKDTVGLEGLALFLLASKGDSLMPSRVTIDEHNMVLKSNTFSLDTVNYSMIGNDGEGYKLKTADGTLHMKLGPANEATLSIEGMTYRLTRTGQQE